MNCCQMNHHGRKHDCRCGEEGGFKRKFSTRAERKEHLETYRAELRNELAGVEEALEQLGTA